ncbi:MAG: DUF4145 domain-containing protein [Desulfotalea sp.]
MGKITRSYSLKTEIKKTEKYICKDCSRETTHKIIATYVERGDEDCGHGHGVDWIHNDQIIQCLGCESVSFRSSSTFSEDWDHDSEGNIFLIENIKYYPGRSEGVQNIESYMLPEKVQSIYGETILAIENEQNILAGIGIRALVETVCKDLNAGGSNLYDKINSLVTLSIVTSEGADTLHKLRVLGNASAHEVKKHNKQQLTVAIEIIEHMLNGTYIIPQKVKTTFK